MKTRKTALNFLFATGLSTLVAMNTGCAFGNRHVDLVYEGAISSRIARGNKKVSLGNFDDHLERDNKGRAIIGCVRNGYGLRTANVLANNEPSEWIRRALEKELENSGYIVEQNVSPTIEGSLVKFYTDMLLKYDSQVTMRIIIKDKNEILYDKVFSGAGREIAWFCTPKEYGKVSEKALEDVMRKAMPEVSTQLERIVVSVGEHDK